MADFQSSTVVNAPVEKVVAFVSDVKNLPKYLPTVKGAERSGEDHVKLQGKVDGDGYTGEGFFRTVEPNKRLEWGSEDHDYRGAMQFDAEGGGTKVTIDLHTNPPQDRKEGIEERSDQDWKSQMEEGIGRSLQSIKQQVEGTGGKDEIPESH